MQENVNIPDSTITTNLSFRNLVLMNMQQLTNFPYIEKDFDALTDYELLCLVVKFLNDVIANQNEQNDSITRMYESFLALQDYVNNTKDTLEDAFNELDDYVRNYFDNLDVQEEINNKLDQMLEDGVLEQIIEQFIQSTALWCFDNVASMKQATNLINGSYAKTLGYYSINDGGGATYKITDTESQSEYQEEVGDLYATLIVEDVVNVKQFGAYGDGAHDDSASVLSAIQHVKTNNTLYFPDGSYLITNTLLINKNINIVGEGILISNNCKPLLLIEGCNNINISLYKLIEQEVRTLDVLDDEYLINAGIVIKDSKFINIKINEIKNFNVGCLLYSSTDTHYNNIEIRRMDTCFYGYEIISHNGGSANGNNFVDTVFDYHTWDTELTPYFILNKSYGSTPYKNNSNIFRGMMAEYGVSATGGPKLLYLEHTHSNIFEFDRVEIASTSGTEPLTINNDNNSNNYIIINYAAQNFTYDNTNGANNVVKVLSGYGSSNLSNNIKNITSTLTLTEGVTIYTGGVWVDYINRICYINVLIRNSADIQPGEDVLSGLPVPKEHVRIYTMSTNGSNPDARPADLQNLLISRSISRGALQTIVQLAFGRSTAINICYKF